jgi:signal transduction histidine kinase
VHGRPELPKLSITTSREDKYVRISIRDNGLGIPKDIQDKIFQPFFTTKLHSEGTGLGLAITHDVIKAHGGKIELQSQEHEFAEFIIYLPLES